jgi:CubicO group peptidase (beta-lactamase class C family)
MTASATKLAVLILAALCSVATARAQDQYGAIRADIEREIAAGRATGVAVALTHKGKIVWEDGFGWADKERGRRVTAHTPFSLASVTKPFTTTTLMTLVAAGQVSLDAPANDYLGTAKIRAGAGNPGAVTVRSLASHSSGLPGTFQIFPAGGALKQPSMDEVIRAYGVLVTPPNERFSYSNVGMGSLRTSRRAGAVSNTEPCFDRKCWNLWGSGTASSIPRCRDTARWRSATTVQATHFRST